MMGEIGDKGDSWNSSGSLNTCQVGGGVVSGVELEVVSELELVSGSSLAVQVDLVLIWRLGRGCIGIGG